ncbi:MAG: cob(I)yrinic acid a,c-diamide adenosyltransferase [Caldithrix sp.]|nr:cob(I)yrinic acid a,c-diamide adenosyltransferase [Caldithrix sp.]
MKLKQGYIQVYTGNGKGKTTAALGQSLRAVGNGLRVLFVQFMKDFPYGEVNMLQQLAPHLELKRYGNDRFVFKRQPPGAELKKQMHDGLTETCAAMQSQQYDMVVLDEVLVSIYFTVLEESAVLDCIGRKPDRVELILTGRYAPDKIIKIADLVTNMEEIKHYYSKGVKARQGIES